MAMELFWVGLALIIPWLAGTLGVRALWRNAPSGGWALALGYGYFLGLLAAILLLRLQIMVGGALDWRWPTLALAVLALGCGVLAWRRGGLSISAGNGWRAIPEPLQRGLWILLLAWLGWRLMMLAQEVWLRPLYPWDAWTTWEVRARVWSELRQWALFVDPQRWQADASAALYTVHAWEYPNAVSLLALWPTLAFAAWNEPVAHLPWVGAALALGLGFYGQARCWGASPLAALVSVWLLLSLPVLDTHVALAGYADLWLAAIFGLAACALLQWARSGDRWQGVLALLLALACPWIKREGLVWALLLIPAALVVWTPRRYWLWLSGGLLLAVIGWWMAGGVAFTVTGWGEIRLTPEVIQLPALGRFELHYHEVWEPVARNLLILANWHLLGYLVLVALLIGLPHIFAEAWRLAGMLLISAGLLTLFVLFFFTEAYLWAVQYTSINRMFLHFTPVLLFWVLTVSVRPPPGSNRSILVGSQMVIADPGDAQQGGLQHVLADDQPGTKDF